MEGVFFGEKRLRWEYFVVDLCGCYIIKRQFLRCGIYFVILLGEKKTYLF